MGMMDYPARVAAVGAATAFTIWAAPHFDEAAPAFYVVAGMFLMLTIFALSIDRDGYRKAKSKFDEQEARVEENLRRSRDRMVRSEIVKTGGGWFPPPTYDPPEPPPAPPPPDREGQDPPRPRNA